MYRFLLAIAAVALLLSACSENGSVTSGVETSSTTGVPGTTIDAGQGIIFGSGALPDTVPADFPIPAEAVIGSTLVDTNRNVTEVILRVPAGVEALAAFFDANLPQRGYAVDASTGGDGSWDIEFSGDAGIGSIAITVGTQDVSQAVVRLTAAG